MADITFFSQGFAIGSGSSGLGFYGSGGFATSIPIASYNTYTFTTNSAGTASGIQLNNTKYTASGSGAINGSGSIGLLAFPNYLMPINVRFTNSSAVRLLNGQARVYDRSDINAGPSGVTAYLASVIHPATGQTLTGSGSSGWVNASGSGSTLTTHTSPGTSGLSPSGSSTIDSQHDVYLAVSVTPTAVGSKLFALYYSTEYL